MIILGSNSKRRRDILSTFRIPFEVVVSHFNEDLIPFQGFAKDYVQLIAAEKGALLAKKYTNRIILTADTTVFLEGEILNKPSSLEEAKIMLQKLSGKKHDVFTGVSVRCGGKIFEGAEMTKVEFNLLDQKQIEAYIKHEDVLDKAGSYAIQGTGSLLIKGIEGCFYNVCGLPINLTRQLLEKVGIHLWDFIESSPSCS